MKVNGSLGLHPGPGAALDVAEVNALIFHCDADILVKSACKIELLALGMDNW
jgi:hypothetical protein